MSSDDARALEPTGQSTAAAPVSPRAADVEAEARTEVALRADAVTGAGAEEPAKPVGEAGQVLMASRAEQAQPGDRPGDTAIGAGQTHTSDHASGAATEVAAIGAGQAQSDDRPGDAADKAEKRAKKARRRKRALRRERKQKRQKRREKKAMRKLAETRELHRANVSDEVAIRFDHVTKSYELFRDDRAQFLGVFNIKGKGYLGPVKANDDLSFEIKRGEAVAFLGYNGAGKSTALKMITGVAHPTEGTVEVNGRVSALLELSAGFDQRLTGRENIHLRGQIMGMDEDEIAEIEPAVVEFADLGVYIDQPMRAYSSGMKARLGFALAVSVSPEILVIDEALSVGDRRFKRKCIKRIREIMMDANVTVLFVTHSSTTAQEFCSRGIVLEKGKKMFDGSMKDAMAFYNARDAEDGE